MGEYRVTLVPDGVPINFPTPPSWGLNPGPQVMLVLYQLSMKILSRQFSAWKYSAVLHYKSCRNANVHMVHLGSPGSKPAQ